jgi:hypothetical protein
MTDQTVVPAASSAPAEGETTLEQVQGSNAPADTGSAASSKSAEPSKDETNSTVTEQEAAPKGEQSDDDDDAETNEQDDRPRKRSRSDRYKSRIAALAAENAELQRRLEAGEQPSNDAPKPPKPEDFQNYTDYEDARAAFNTQQAVNAALRESRKQENQTRLNEARSELVEEFMDGVSKIKERIPDYDEVMKADVKIRADISDLILSSEKGPHLAYELAKGNGAKLKELNAMTPVEAARAIGRIEARLSLPTPKKQTQAPAPIKPPTGGAAPLRDIASLAKSEDIGDYIAARNAAEKA